MRFILWLLRLSGFTQQYALVPAAEWTKVQELLSVVDPNRLAHAKLGGASVTFSTTACIQAVNDIIDDFAAVKRTAEEAHTMSAGALPVSRVVATKIEGTAVVAGLPDDPDPSKYMTKK